MAEVQGDATVLLGDLDLNAGMQAGDPYGFETLADFDSGQLQAIRVSQSGYYLDGGHQYISGYDLRTRVMQVRVTGVTGGSLNDAEAVLMRAANVATTLTLRMPEDDADTVIEVCNTVVDVVDDDLAYMLRRQRTYRLTLTTQPFARTSDLVTVTFSSGAGSVTTLDAGTATTNWAQVTGSPAPATGTYASDSAIKLDPGVYADDNPTLYPGSVVAVDWTGTVGASSDYLVLDWASESGGAQPRLGATYATAAEPVAIIASPLGMSYHRSIFVNTGGTPRFWLTGGHGYSHIAVRLWIGNLGKTTGLPAGSLYNMPTPGALRTFGSLKVYNTNGSDMTQDVAVYSDPTMATYGWQPNVASTWPVAPAGQYVAYIPSTSPVTTGTSVALTFTAASTGKAQTMSTTVDPSSQQAVLGTPFGVFDLAGTRDGRVGRGTWSVSGGITLTSNLVLIRVTDAATGFGGSASGLGDADEAKLSAVKAYGSHLSALFFDPPSGAQPQGGVWGVDGVNTLDVGDNLTSWAWHVFTPPLTPLWIPVGDPFTSPANLSFDVSLYGRYGHNVSAAS